MRELLEGRAQGINFWNEVAPLLVSLRTPVYLFAGDVGARGFLPACGYGEYENLTFITSGMGGGARDNLVVVAHRVDQVAYHAGLLHVYL